MIVARNLEMLLLAWLARWFFAPRAALVYELLDIHTLMVGRTPMGRGLRAIERVLLRSCRLVIVSSPAFIHSYLARFQAGHPPALLVENKVFPATCPGAALRPSGPPWRIGWFGNLRCRTSLDCLLEVARRTPSLIEIDLRGIIACDTLTTLPQEVADLPNVFWHGRYESRDLPEIYGRVHFCWAIDYFQSGLNSAWLLPNRLYESCLHDCQPLAVATVETGRWLEAHGLTGRLEEPLADSMVAFLAALTPADYEKQAAHLSTLDRGLFRHATSDCEAFVATLVGTTASP
ncbi:glycosyltransferase family protein [Pararhodospirillum oryzae]|uniref:glycosyl transferase family 1 n=1 Tax=Pararhodospirillum oryzae TaxID=478448 RepID=UPI0014784291|nr:glycosyl transferase family 1 [Pararhodospirillum oryzae]